VTELRERDAMMCRSCGMEERASEGYPCKDCGTFICIMCVFKGVIRCERCAASAGVTAASSSDPGSLPAVPGTTAMDWPDH
jgi:hypothetical protein